MHASPTPASGNAPVLACVDPNATDPAALIVVTGFNQLIDAALAGQTASGDAKDPDSNDKEEPRADAPALLAGCQVLTLTWVPPEPEGQSDAGDQPESTPPPNPGTAPADPAPLGTGIRSPIPRSEQGRKVDDPPPPAGEAVPESPGKFAVPAADEASTALPPAPGSDKVLAKEASGPVSMSPADDPPGVESARGSLDVTPAGGEAGSEAARGITAAPTSAWMISRKQWVENARRQVQLLPGGDPPSTPFEDSTALRPAAAAGGLGGAGTSTNGAVDAPSGEPHGRDPVNHAPGRTLALVSQGLDAVVTEFRQTGAYRINLVVRADRDTQVALELVSCHGRIEASARVLNGDAPAWAGEWSQLQERMARQGVRLGDLENMTGFANGGARRDSQPRYQPAPGETIEPVTTELRPRRRPRRPAAVRSPGWEVWA